MNRAELGELKAMRARAWLVAAPLLVLVAAAETILRTALPAPPGLAVAVAALLLAYPTLVAPRRRYASLGYAIDDRELSIARGIWTRVETVVPLVRVQHIDIAQGPIERRFGVCRLVLHTAGTAHARVVLPGLSRPSAEAMRDAIRAHIVEDAL